VRKTHDGRRLVSDTVNYNGRHFPCDSVHIVLVFDTEDR
jgi:hypothetical protein